MKLFSLLPLLLLALPSLVSSLNSFEPTPHLLPRPLILELPSYAATADEDTQLRCASWWVAAEANNLAPWKTIPSECADYVKDCLSRKKYRFDLEMVAREASACARSVEVAADGKDVWVFDVDETLLSNLPYYQDPGFGLEVFNGQEFDKWVTKAMAPAI